MNDNPKPNEARQRILLLTSMYRRLRHMQPTDGAWDWWLQMSIEALENETAAKNEKMAALAGRHSLNRIFENNHITIITAPGGQSKEVAKPA